MVGLSNKARRFPPPWSIEEANNPCFIVRDSTGQVLAYVYFEDEPGRRSAAKLLAKASPLRLIRYVWSSTGPLCPRCRKDE
jgi:hypothetical protein